MVVFKKNNNKNRKEHKINLRQIRNRKRFDQKKTDKKDKREGSHSRHHEKNVDTARAHGIVSLEFTMNELLRVTPERIETSIAHFSDCFISLDCSIYP